MLARKFRLFIDRRTRKDEVKEKRRDGKLGLQMPVLTYRPASEGNSLSTVSTCTPEPLKTDDLLEQSSPQPLTDTRCTRSILSLHNADVSVAKQEFGRLYPEYAATAHLDDIRKEQYQRLDQTGEVYLDYTGGSLYPSSLIDWHHDLLSSQVFGNPHSASPASALSTHYEDVARKAVLDFVHAGDEYEVIFTSNTTGGIKLVAEAYQFQGGRVLIMSDAHNSVVGLARLARARGASVDMVKIDEETIATDLDDLEHKLREGKPGLILFTGQSNVSGYKIPHQYFNLARELGWEVGLDAAALLPTTSFSLCDTSVDFVVMSIYKITGYPTGVGALVISKDFRRKLVRPTFAGGTVDAVEMPSMRFRLFDSHAGFEDGTVNYLALAAVARGLKFVGPLIPSISSRTSCLIAYLYPVLKEIHFDNADRTPLLEVRGNPLGADHGSILSMLFFKPQAEREIEAYRFIIWAAARRKISLRGGPCLCNPGGSYAVMRGEGHEDWEVLVNIEAGIIRLSLGIASNFEDVYSFVLFCRYMAVVENYECEKAAWQAQS